MQTRPAVATISLVASLTFSAVLFGQSSGQATRQPATAVAQNMLANRDISGVWNAKAGVYGFASFSNDDPPMTPWGRARFNAAKPSQGEQGVKLTETNDRVYKCSPPGMPYIYLQLFPMQIVQTATEIIEFFEYDHTVRHIYMGGRKHPAGLKPSYNGHSVGHWEDDTLVVDTIGLNGKTWLDRLGRPEGTRMHIVERIRRQDNETLQVDFIFDDAENYLMPWTAQIRFQRHSDWDILEHVCEDNLAFESFEH
jgi:hypothetical protein